MKAGHGGGELRQSHAELVARVQDLSFELAKGQAMTQLAAGAMHDLRNILHVALSAAETLLETATQPDERELIKTVIDAAEHGGHLARDLLALARGTDAGGEVIRCLDLLPSIQRLMAQATHGRWRCRIEASPHAGAIMVQPAQLEAVLLNLCFNARDAMPAGGEVLLRVRGLPEDAPLPEGTPLPGDTPLPGNGARGQRYVEFAVMDTGKGMSEEVLARATQAFFTTKGASGGTGLGLAMAQAFATRTGGALRLESEIGRGTCVRLILPRAQEIEVTTEGDAQLDRLALRIRHADLQHAFAIWRQQRQPGRLPAPLELGARLARYEDTSIVLAVDNQTTPGVLRLVRVGSILARALEQQPLDDIALEGCTSPGTLDGAYRRAWRSSAPSYEHASVCLMDGEPGSFERLILPAAVDGEHVSHLVGVIHFGGSLR